MIQLLSDDFERHVLSNRLVLRSDAKFRMVKHPVSFWMQSPSRVVKSLEESHKQAVKALYIPDICVYFKQA